MVRFLCFLKVFIFKNKVVLGGVSFPQGLQFCYKALRTSPRQGLCISRAGFRWARDKPWAGLVYKSSKVLMGQRLALGKVCVAPPGPGLTLVFDIQNPCSYTPIITKFTLNTGKTQ